MMDKDTMILTVTSSDAMPSTVIVRSWPRWGGSGETEML